MDWLPSTSSTNWRTPSTTRVMPIAAVTTKMPRAQKNPALGSFTGAGAELGYAGAAMPNGTPSAPAPAGNPRVSR